MFEDEDREFREDREQDDNRRADDRMNEMNENDNGGEEKEPWGDRQDQDGQDGQAFEKFEKDDPQSGWVENHPNAQIPEDPVHSSAGMPPVAKKIVKVAAAAVLFGVIAGGTMFGVNEAGNYLKNQYFPKSETQLTIAQAPTADQNGDAAPSAQTGMDVSEIAANAMPSVVAINNTMLMQQQTWFGPGRTVEVPSSGSGIIVGQNDSELLIVTNNHVVEDSNQLTVTFIDNSQVNATIKGTDAEQDLAVIAVSLKDIPAEAMNQIKIATLGDSDALKVGQGVVAIGNALGYGQSVTVGYISALDREVKTSETDVKKLLQTDAAINPGNSGGALLNMRGEVIGINSAKYSSTEVEGMGYAIPVSQVKDIISQLMNRKNRTEVAQAQQGYLGIQGQNIDDNAASMYGMPKGIYVYKIVENGAASKSDLKEKDIITKFDGQSVRTMADLKDLLKYYRSGETVELTVQSLENGEYQERTVSITLGNRPAESKQ